MGTPLTRRLKAKASTHLRASKRLHIFQVMTEDLRQRILNAAARTYAQHGWRGATTRRIADDAGVNEVSLFRHFGSKDALLDAMMQEQMRLAADIRLPDEPVDPEAELFNWAAAQYRLLASQRAIAQQMMSDAFDRPEAALCVSKQPCSASESLRNYVVQLRRQGRIADAPELSPTEVAAAVTMLMSAIFSDAMHRDLMPLMFVPSVDDALRCYVRIFLRGLGAPTEPFAMAPRTDDRLLSFSTVPA
jgi:AcrR family transcriptional regulator